MSGTFKSSRNQRVFTKPHFPEQKMNTTAACWLHTFKKDAF